MRFLFVLLLISLIVTRPAAAQRVSDELVDAHAVTVTGDRPDTLAARLTRPFRTDREKVRALFRWVAHYIAYEVRSPRMPKQVRDTAWDGLPLDERVAYATLRRRSGVCEGFARLFNTLCHYAGIRSELVSGYVRNDDDRTDRGVLPNHSWNAVYFDSSWHLLDATWAAGYMFGNTSDFVRAYDNFYFLTPPEKMIRNHYPEDFRWTLMKTVPPLRELRYHPFRTTASLKYRIRQTLPASGTITAVPGDTLRFTVELQAPVRPDAIAPDEDDPKDLYPKRARQALLEPEASFGTRRLRYTYVLRPGVEWITLRCNSDAILHYQVLPRPVPDPGQ
ncbi:transglutaminase domain-containing protein [Flaviaesturariibacter amylovorans]|uniref:Transglutaminase-like domain-containing protein n=1 Tax=Flaviaesturariibacter amylovorans TaxID=1084520 RepID=A0ABP8GVA0_9BACT